MTQNELANKLGISRGTYAHYEINKRQPDYETLQKLADFFDTSVDYLLGRTNVSPEYKNKTDLIDQLEDKQITFEGRELTEKQKKRVIRILKAFLLDDEDKKKE